MVILVVILYLVLIAAVLALVCLPAWRERIWAASRRVPARVAQLAGALWGRSAGRVQRAVVPLRVAGHGARAAWPAPGLGWAAALLALLLAPALALLLRQWHAYDGFDHTDVRSVNPRIAELLQGEQLVPPPRLPPDLFTTREVEQARPLAATASRQWELLDTEFRQRLLTVFKLMRDQHGYEMVLIEGYRSPERQAQLAGLGPHVTHAGAGQSYHQYGLAADCAFLRDGRIVISERDPWAAKGYELYGAVAQSAGLNWGGAWRTLADLGHVELPRPGVLQGPKAPA